MQKDVVILTGAGQIGMAIVRRIGYGKKIVIGDKGLNNAQTIAKIRISYNNKRRASFLQPNDERKAQA